MGFSRIKWVMDNPVPDIICGARRGRRGNTLCELPADHTVGRLPGPPVREHNHFGRSRSGRWFSWEPDGGA